MIPWYEKAAIGAIGALCLGLLKLTDANFYLGAADRSATLGAYLTYTAYLVMGMAVAFFFCDDTRDRGKSRKSAFLMGLLAPSILVAVLTRPVSAPSLPTATDADITKLGHSMSVPFFPAAYAEEPKAPSPVTTLSARDLSPGFADGVYSALGMKSIPSNYLFILAKTTKRELAVARAEEINALLQKVPGQDKIKARVFKIEGNDDFYLALGNPSSPEGVTAIKQAATRAAASILKGRPTEAQAATSRLLLEGKTVKGDALLKK